MKKFVSLLMLFAILISCCACAAEEATPETTVAPDATEALPEETEPQLVIPELEDVLAEYEAKQDEGKPTNEQLYGMINQLEPVGGVYKIWNAEGVKNIANHPDAKFEFLCNVDMGGITIRPIGTKDKPFTGDISGVNCTISNFTVEASDDGYLGFLGVNEGTIRNITLENVTYVSKDNTKYMGGVAAVSTQEIGRVTVRGTMEITAAAEDAICGGFVGQMHGDIINSVTDVDIHYGAAGSATIGGIVGSGENSRIEFTENYGDIVAEGSNKKAGLIAGDAKTLDLYNVSFLGEKNTVDGTLFTNYFGTEEAVTFERVLVRDNTPYEMPENVAKLRDTVVAAMYEMGTVRWSTTQDLYHDCHCLLGVCHGAYKKGMLHIGIPYNHYSTTFARFQACLDEDGFAKDWMYSMPSMEGFDTYFGNDCSGAVQAAWWTVSTSTDVMYCENMQPIRSQYGCLPVGQWPTHVDVPAGSDSKDLVTPLISLEEWFEAFAQVRRGDAYVHIGKDGNHTRMAQEDPVIVRDENGVIDGDYSYIITIEQGAPATMEPYFCSWRYDYKYTFKNLVLGGYMPVTCIELITGEVEPVDLKLEGGGTGRAGMTLGTLSCNYNIDTVTLEVKDSQGNVAFNHTLNPNASYRSDWGSTDMGIRNKSEVFPLTKFATPLADAEFELGETYTYTISVLLSNRDVIVVAEDSFTNGSAQ